MSRPQSTRPAVLARTLLLGALPVSGCLWVSDAELAARLEREGGPGAGELTEEVVEGLLDTADPDPDPDPVVDLDGDGAPAGIDCDDADPLRSPDFEERCDGVDNDCDERIDEDATDSSSWSADSDGDGYTDPSTTLEACTAPSGYLAASDEADCDDQDAEVHPGQLERLGDGLDQNCDGALGPALEAVPGLSGPGRAPVALETRSQSGADAVVLAWMSARCGAEEAAHLCGGTLAWEPEEGQTWAAATADPWERPDLEADALVSFSYSEQLAPTWGWISQLEGVRSATISPREPAGDFDAEATQTQSWSSSASSPARVDLQSFQQSGSDLLLGLICDEAAGIFHTRQAGEEGVLDGVGFDTSYRTGLCALSHLGSTPLMLERFGDAQQIAWGGRAAIPMYLGFEPIDLASTPSQGGLGLQAALGTEQLAVQHCESTGGLSRCTAQALLTVDGGLRMELAHDPLHDQGWACVVHEDGTALLLQLTDLETSTADSWELDGVEEATSCAVAVVSAHSVVVAVNTPDEVKVGQVFIDLLE